MAALSDPTTKLSAAGPALPGGSAAAENQAEAPDRLIQQVEQLLRESGHTEPFDAAGWLDRWLQRPNHALGGAAPELYLSTPEGQALLSSLIGAMAAGSYL
jgi:hypothetical protein